MVAIGFIEKQFQTTITWAEWFVTGAPFSALTSMALYFIMTRMMRPEMKEITGGQAAISEQVEQLGAMTPKERKLLVIVLTLLGAWAAEGVGAKIGPSDGIVFDDFAAEYLDIWQEIGEK